MVPAFAFDIQVIYALWKEAELPVELLFYLWQCPLRLQEQIAGSAEQVQPKLLVLLPGAGRPQLQLLAHRVGKQ